MITDIKINLLPWREEVREEKKRDFLKITIAVFVLAAAIVGGFDRYYNGAIDLQISRNAFLQVEIQILEGRIEDIRLLQQKRNELLSRMKVIQELQGNRPIIVRVFDELAR
ncbi:MAG: pilus assembly protein PilN, partial [Gammaproteobacteria bacterium]|nr:pilus assembly protein PilN [Gammaproteobacteria bacterium]